jgi:AcrR family transcriptional regulator
MQENKMLTEYKKLLRERILNVAIHAFAEHGVKATKMDDLSSRLGISKRTLYEICDNKETVLFESIKHHNRQKEAAMIAFTEDSSHDVLDTIIFIYQRKLKESESITPAFYEEASLYPKIADYLKQQRDRSQVYFMNFIRQGIDEGYFLSSINYNLISHVFNAMGGHMHKEHLYERYSFDDLFFNMPFVVLRGFCTEKGIRKLDCFFVQQHT